MGDLNLENIRVLKIRLDFVVILILLLANILLKILCNSIMYGKIIDELYFLVLMLFAIQYTIIVCVLFYTATNGVFLGIVIFCIWLH